MESQEERDLLGGLSPGLAYDFNTLLTPIHTYFQLVATNSEKAESLRRTAAQNASELLWLIKDARIFSPEEHLQTSECNLDEISKRAMRPCKALIEKRRVDFETDWTSNPTIEANSFLLQRLFTNLLQNAIEGRAGKVAVSSGILKKGDDTWNQIRIEDDGAGIEDNILPHIFEQAFSTKGSSGLGLAIASKIVQIHEGHIEVESEAAKGTKVTIYLSSKLE